MRLIKLFVLCVFLAACGGGGGSVSLTETVQRPGGSGGPSTPAPPAQPTPPAEPPRVAGEDFRVFRMSATPVQFLPIENRPLRNGNEDFLISDVDEDLDVVAIVADYIGVPFDLFAQGMDIPEDHPWTIVARQLIDRVQMSNLPVLLQLGLVRRAAVGRAEVVDGELDVNLLWAPSCFDFTSPEAEEIGVAYINYAAWMAREFQPLYVVNFAEANLYYTNCERSTPSWDKLVEIQNEAYDRIKEEVPDAIVFASTSIEGLYNDTLNGWDEEQYQDVIRMKNDIFAMASYPFGNRLEDGTFVTPYDLPGDYFSRVKDRHPEVQRLGIAETGWNSASLFAGDEEFCAENFPYSEEQFALDFATFVINSAHSLDFDLVNWFSFRDTLPAEVVSNCFPRVDGTDPENDACMGDFFCQAVNQAKNVVNIPGQDEIFSEVVLKAFGTMGLKEYTGDSRDLLFRLWRDTYELPLEYELSDEEANPDG